MASEQHQISSSEFMLHTPALEKEADNIMGYMSSLSPIQISEILGISQQLSIKAHSLAYDFPHKLTGYQALYAFIGEAYRGLDIKTLDEKIQNDADNFLRIISSVYGILKPSDIIKPYRCEYTKPICPGGKTPVQVFKSKNTIEVVNYLKEKKDKDLIDLLPADADKCLDWKIIRAFTSVHKVCFQTITPDGRLKTPIAQKLKELRGIMCRTIMEKGIKSFEELKSVESEHFIFSPKDSKPGLPVFISA